MYLNYKSLLSLVSTVHSISISVFKGKYMEHLARKYFHDLCNHAYFLNFFANTLYIGIIKTINTGKDLVH